MLLRRKRKHIFIFAQPRSGSTLLTGILNTINGCAIQGERNNILLKFVKTYFDYEFLTKRENKNDKDTSPFFGWSKLPPSRRYARALVKFFTKNILCPDCKIRIIGLKEVKQTSLQSGAGMDDYVKFLMRFFTNTKIIFNIRNEDDIFKSVKRIPDFFSNRVLKMGAAGFEERVVNAKKYYQAIQARNSTQIILVEYEKIIDGFDEIDRLFSFFWVPLAIEEMKKKRLASINQKSSLASS